MKPFRIPESICISEELVPLNPNFCFRPVNYDIYQVLTFPLIQKWASLLSRFLGFTVSMFSRNEGALQAHGLGHLTFV